ncbi:hypothetical protein [Duganella levis]|uniref:Secreted protein n=1 Tax=Duganella levis TaxID=2692169 RepID=A0ABW9VWB4_9BURK|nr:hypothetical protein [Duganella levis]MYN25922.1 hypothetical protein [Duganella levis]
MKKYAGQSLAAGIVLLILLSPAHAGDPSSAVAAVADAPPETQVRILKLVFNDMFGSRAELKAKFVAACQTREKAAPAAAAAAPAKPAKPISEVAQQKAGELSQEAVLAALCSGPARRQVEAALTPPVR